MIELNEVLENVSDYNRFLTVDELTTSSKSLVNEFPEYVKPLSLGSSGKGEEIQALTIGEGSLHAVLVGGIHPFEPVGSLMQEYLSRTLAENPELVKNLGVSWTFIKCIDPDRMRLNELWFNEEFTPLNFAQSWFRPATKHQVAWTFPVNYKTLVWKEVLPETRCLMNLIDSRQVHFLYSLHNSFFSGAWFQVTKDYPSLYNHFRELVVNEEIPLSANNDKMISHSVYLYEGIKNAYDKLLNEGIKDPAKHFSSGTSPSDYALQRWDAFGLLCEVPYFFDPRVGDDSPSEISRKEAMLRQARIYSELASFLKLKYEQVKKYLHESPFKDSVEELMLRESRLAIQHEKDAKQNGKSSETISIAEELGRCVLSIFEPTMTSLGMFIRMLMHEKDLSSQNLSNIEREIESVHYRLMEENDKLMKQVNLHVPTLKSLVRIQLGACLHTLEHLKTTL